MGDYGTGTDDQKKVAYQLSEFLSRIEPPPSFVVSTGDQIYEAGYVFSFHDDAAWMTDTYRVAYVGDPQFKTKYEMIYTAPSVQVPWYIS